MTSEILRLTFVIDYASDSLIMYLKHSITWFTLYTSEVLCDTLHTSSTSLQFNNWAQFCESHHDMISLYTAVIFSFHQLKYKFKDKLIFHVLYIMKLSLISHHNSIFCCNITCVFKSWSMNLGLRFKRTI